MLAASVTHDRTSSGRVETTRTTNPPPQSCPTRSTGSSRRSSWVASQPAYSSIVASKPAGRALSNPGSDSATVHSMDEHGGHGAHPVTAQDRSHQAVERLTSRISPAARITVSPAAYVHRSSAHMPPRRITRYERPTGRGAEARNRPIGRIWAVGCGPAEALRVIGSGPAEFVPAEYAHARAGLILRCWARRSSIAGECRRVHLG